MKQPWLNNSFHIIKVRTQKYSARILVLVKNKSAPSYLCSISGSLKQKKWKTFGVGFLFSVKTSDALCKKLWRLRCCAAEDPSAEWIISWALMSSGLTSQVLSAARPLKYSLPAAVQKKAPEGARSPRAAPGLLQHCVLCIIVLISTDNIPADPRFQSCRLKGQNFSPSSPRRLIPGFTSSALRKFNCNLGLDKILLLQKVGATW